MATTPQRERPHADIAPAGPAARTGIGPRWLLDPIRQAGKRLFNPLVLTFSGRRGPYAVVRHVGRRSGRPYVTPVVAASLGDDFVIPLPFGTEADWCCNIQAAGQCTLQRGGITYALTTPQVIDQASALPAFPAPARLA